MTDVFFYHLERSNLEGVLPDLLEKTLARGWRALVRTTSAERAAAIDEFLWTGRDDSFLPHAAGGEPEFAARQPVWITAGEDHPNAAQVLFLVDGVSADESAIAPFERCVSIFDGGDASALTQARAFWKSSRDAGREVAYWSQTPEGRWERKA